MLRARSRICHVFSYRCILSPALAAQGLSAGINHTNDVYGFFVYKFVEDKHIRIVDIRNTKRKI